MNAADWLAERGISQDSAPAQDKAPTSPPSLPRQMWNLTASLAAFAADGLKCVSCEEYAARLAICDACEHRHDNKCKLCGCRLSVKAKGRAFQCPAGKWPRG